MKKIVKVAGIIVGNLLFILLVFEGILRIPFVHQLIWDRLPLRATLEPNKPAMYLADKALGHRPNPRYPGFDSRGWRNAEALTQANIVALGDSQTYGTIPDHKPNENLIDKAWPQTLGRSLHTSVYQMAFGGFGPAHYVLLIDEALKLRPKTLLASYYFGNDVLDSYWLAYNKKPEEFQRGPNAVLDGFLNQDPAVLRDLAIAESIDPNHIRHGYLDCQGGRAIPDPSFQRIRDIMHSPALTQNIVSPYRIGSFDLFTHSSLLQTIDRALESKKKKRLIKTTSVAGNFEKPICVPFAKGRYRTTLSPAYRLLTLMDDDPRVREGERLSLLSFKYVADRARENNVAFYVVMIPTKEMVYERVGKPELLKEEYVAELWKQETRIREAATAFLKANGIAVIDTLPDLQDALENGTNPYPLADGNPLHNAEGHPTAVGYSIIAKTVEKRLKKDTQFSWGR